MKKGTFLGARRRARRAAAWIAASVVASGAWAQSGTEAASVVGIKAGPVIIAPSVEVGYAYDSNVLQRPDEVAPEPDQILTLQPAIQITIPFSNSSFRFGDVWTYVDYNQTAQTRGKSANDAVAELTLNFGSLDQLEISAHNIVGVSETLAFDPGGEVGFQGNTFTLHTEAVTFSRAFPGARGFRFGLERNALRFDPSITVNFYNSRGFEGEAAYFQPLSPNTRLAFGYLGSRYDQFRSQDPSTLNRTESGDIVYGQIEGQLGPRQPYMVRLGWDRLAFADAQAATTPIGDFSGVIGQVNLSAIVGGGTALSVAIQRQPYRSYDLSNSFYVSNLAVGSVERLFLGGTSVGGSLLFAINGYRQISSFTTTIVTDPPTDPPPTVTTYYHREDRRVQLEAHANLELAERVAFRVSLARTRRYSNAPFADYNNTVFFGGFVLGWI